MVSAVTLDQHWNIVSIARRNVLPLCPKSLRKLRGLVRQHFGAGRGEVESLTIQELFDLVPEDDMAWRPRR